MFKRYIASRFAVSATALININFKRYFENDFILKTRNEIIDEKILGDGVNNKLLEESIGDFVALGVTDKYFRYCNYSINFKSMHAGFTEDEMIIPLIIVSK